MSTPSLQPIHPEVQAAVAWNNELKIQELSDTTTESLDKPVNNATLLTLLHRYSQNPIEVTDDMVKQIVMKIDPKQLAKALAPYLPQVVMDDVVAKTKAAIGKDLQD